MSGHTLESYDLV